MDRKSTPKLSFSLGVHAVEQEKFLKENMDAEQAKARDYMAKVISIITGFRFHKPANHKLCAQFSKILELKLINYFPPQAFFVNAIFLLLFTMWCILKFC